MSDQQVHPAAEPAPVTRKTFEREKHIQYFKRNLQVLPEPYTSQDTNRLVLAMFSLGGLDLLGVLQESVSEANRKDWIEWIYSQQRVPPSNADPVSPETEALYGFGGPFTGLAFKQGSEERPNIGCECDGHTNEYDSSHLTMTYAALVSLLILGDDLSRVARGPITQALKRLQLENGCFMSCVTDPQADLRFLYSAAVISYILNDWSGFDRVKALEFIQQCETYEHGFARTPGLEAHGGTTYCAVATLGLLGGEALLDQKTLQRDVEGGEDEAGFQARVSRAGFRNKEVTRRWCLERQLTGFQGRVNKPTDTCYSFWIGGALDVLGSMDLVNEELNRGYLMETQHKKIGGFAKWVDHFPDPLHSYMGIAGLALMGEPGIQKLDPLLNVSERTRSHLYSKSVFWQ